MEKTAGEKLTVYEVGYLLLSTIAEEQVEGIVAKIKGILADTEAVIIEEGAPTMRALAYTMDKVIETKRFKFDHAYFGWVKFEGESKNIAAIKKSVESLPEILRALFIKTVRENTMIGGKLAAEEAAALEAPLADDAEKPVVVEEDAEKVEAAVV